jgi:tight adherence protein B
VLIIVFVSIIVYFLVRLFEKAQHCRRRERIFWRLGKSSLVLSRSPERSEGEVEGKAGRLEERVLALERLVRNLLSPLMTKRRLRRVEVQLPDFLLFMSNALRASLSIRQALQEASQQVAAPLGDELRILKKELELGTGLEEALRNMVSRLPLKNLDLTATALITAHQAGGNLVHILDSLSEAIRQRLNLKQDIQVLTSQGRLSGLILSGLPIGFLLFMLLFSRERVAALLSTNIGWSLLIVGLGLNLAGFLWIRKIVAIEV